MRYDTAAMTALGANIAAMFQSMTGNGMRRKEALAVVVAVATGMLAVAAAQKQQEGNQQ
jgi:hypothetical protein